MQDVEGPWKCLRCERRDNQTVFRNEFCVSVSGESNSIVEGIGEEIDGIEHEMQLCDACSRNPTIKSWCLSYALERELFSLGVVA